MMADIWTRIGYKRCFARICARNYLSVIVFWNELKFKLLSYDHTPTDIVNHNRLVFSICLLKSIVYPSFTILCLYWYHGKFIFSGRMHMIKLIQNGGGGDKIGRDV